MQLGPCLCWKSLAAGRETLPQQITTTRGEGGIWSNCDRIRDAHPSLELRQSLRNLGVDTWVEHLARGVVVHPLERIFRCVSALAHTVARLLAVLPAHAPTTRPGAADDVSRFLGVPIQLPNVRLVVFVPGGGARRDLTSNVRRAAPGSDRTEAFIFQSTLVQI